MNAPKRARKPEHRVVFDLETVRRASVPFEPKAKMVGRRIAVEPGPTFNEVEMGDAIKLYDAFPFGSPACHEIACIGYLSFEDYTPTVFKIVDAPALPEDHEEAQLNAFLPFLADASLVTFNGRRFDVPVLAAGALRYGIPIPWYYEGRNIRYRYAHPSSPQVHVDVMEQLSDYGSAVAMSLEQAARLIGLPGKPVLTHDLWLGSEKYKAGDSIDGSKVEAMIAEGHRELVHAYCLTDVLQTAILWLRFELVRGALELDEYQRAVQAVRRLARSVDSLQEPSDPTSIVTRAAVRSARTDQAFAASIDWKTVLLVEKSESSGQHVARVAAETVDWAVHEAFPKNTITCACGKEFRSHSKFVVTPDAGLVTQSPCPECFRHDPVRASSDAEIYTLNDPRPFAPISTKEENS